MNTRNKLFLFVSASLVIAVVLLVVGRAKTNVVSTDVAASSALGSKLIPFESGDTSRSAVAAASSMPRSRQSLHDDAWYLAQSDDVKASIDLGMGDNFHGYGTIVGYLNSLNSRIARGDLGAALEKADMIRTCQLIPPEALSSSGNPAHRSARACATLPRFPADLDRRLVNQAADRGYREAILRQLSFPPLDVVSQPQSKESVQWIDEVTARLSELSRSGSLEATWQLGRLYTSGEFRARDFDRAIQLYAAYLRASPANDPRHVAAENYMTNLCASGRLSAVSLGYCQ